MTVPSSTPGTEAWPPTSTMANKTTELMNWKETGPAQLPGGTSTNTASMAIPQTRERYSARSVKIGGTTNIMTVPSSTPGTEAWPPTSTMANNTTELVNWNEPGLTADNCMANSVPPSPATAAPSAKAATLYLWALTPRVVAASSRSDKHTSERQSLMRISYAVLCLQQRKMK